MGKLRGKRLTAMNKQCFFFAPIGTPLFFLGGGKGAEADPHAILNLCLDLKSML